MGNGEWEKVKGTRKKGTRYKVKKLVSEILILIH